MSTKEQLDRCYMDVAEAHARLSKAKRDHVGVVIVTRKGVMLGGVNGMAPGGSNELEYLSDENTLVSKPQVIHAELNAVLKAAKEGVSLTDATLYTTLGCCMECSEMVAAAGVSRVVYKDSFKNPNGIQNLIELGVDVCKFGQKQNTGEE